MTSILTKLFSPRRASLLGLALEGRRVDGVLHRRNNDGTSPEQNFNLTLSLDPLTNDPQLVGQELRNQLDEAGIKETRCVIGIPLNWVITLAVALPEIPDEDAPEYLTIQAEKGFPYAPEDLHIVTTRTGNAATLLAVPRAHLTRLEEVLAAARLRPVSFTTAITALQTPDAGPDAPAVVALLVGESRVDLLISGANASLLALRTFDGVIETDGAARRIDSDLLVRELRLTLGQLPEQIRNTARTLRVFGPADWTGALAKEIAPDGTLVGLTLDVRATSPAAGIAARAIENATCAFEFLPPRVSQWMKLTARFSSRKLLWSTATATAALLLVGGMFLVQYIELSILESRWAKIEPSVSQIAEMNQNTRQFHSWYAHSSPTLRLLKQMTDSFPDDGTVTVKTLEIKNQADISCSGYALDNTSVLKTHERLRVNKRFNDVKLLQTRGRVPLQFTLNCHWVEGGAQ